MGRFGSCNEEIIPSHSHIFLYFPMIFPGFPTFSLGFPRFFPGFPTFSPGFPTCFPGFPRFTPGKSPLPMTPGRRVQAGIAPPPGLERSGFRMVFGGRKSMGVCCGISGILWWYVSEFFFFRFFFFFFRIFRSPPARWGLLDFMSVAAPSPSPPRRTSTTTIHAQCSLPDLNHDHPRPVFAVGPQPRPATPSVRCRPQPRPSTPSVRCRTSTTTSHAQCSLPDLNHDHPRPVFAAGPQPRPSTPSVRCGTSTTTINSQCSLPDLNSYAKSYAR